MHCSQKPEELVDHVSRRMMHDAPFTCEGVNRSMHSEYGDFLQEKYVMKKEAVGVLEMIYR